MDGPDWVPLDRDSRKAPRPEEGATPEAGPLLSEAFEYDRPWLDRHPDRRRLDLVALMVVFGCSAAIVVTALTGLLILVDWMIDRLA